MNQSFIRYQALIEQRLEAHEETKDLRVHKESLREVSQTFLESEYCPFSQSRNGKEYRSGQVTDASISTKNTGP